MSTLLVSIRACLSVNQNEPFLHLYSTLRCSVQGTVSSGADVSLKNCSDNPEAPAFTEWPEEKEWAETIKAKLGDTVSDIGLIAKRTLKRLPNRNRITAQINKGMQRANNGDNSQPISLQSTKPIVLVLGSGWAAHSLIKASLPPACTPLGGGWVSIAQCIH